MRFVSTAGKASPVSLEEAVFAGPAPDGGLYVPELLPTLTPPTDGSLVDTAFTVAVALFADDIDRGALESIVRESLDFEIPLVPLDDGIASLELFHGPTHAFKDVGARFMARLMLHFLEKRNEEATVLVATSGDTGSAVAHAFYRLEGIRVVVLFPRGKVSDLQRQLFTTLGENVSSLAVDGTFDDCQRLVKRAFADGDLERLVSANSINVARLLPQTFYYFHAFAQLDDSAREDLAVCTPSGNFGNLTAGLLAKRMGLPVSQFIAATNVNDVVPGYLATGEFRPRASRETLSNAMDVGNPSNFARMLWLYYDDVEAMRRDLDGYAYTDEQTRETIASVHRRIGYVLDPHSAIGYMGARESQASSRVFLATAHPAKFRETVEPVIERAIPLPPSMRDAASRPEHVTEIAADYDALKESLTS